MDLRGSKVIQLFVVFTHGCLCQLISLVVIFCVFLNSLLPGARSMYIIEFRYLQLVVLFYYLNSMIDKVPVGMKVPAQL